MLSNGENKYSITIASYFYSVSYHVQVIRSLKDILTAKYNTTAIDFVETVFDHQNGVITSEGNTLFVSSHIIRDKNCYIPCFTINISLSGIM